MTERHLIEELAAIIWRKRRVLLAEAAKINEGLKQAANNLRPVMASAAPFQPWFGQRAHPAAGSDGRNPGTDRRDSTRGGT
jgi:hypothetical protein